MRRALIHGQPKARVPSMAKLAGNLHLHCCADRDCRLVYQDTCRAPELNGRCQVCKGRRRPIWVTARDAIDCCFNNCEQVTDKALLRHYVLAGPGPWFQCKTCARCHGWPCA